jgi:predicted DCC family thiol-disulfide oxidoreductase YuxK
MCRRTARAAESLALRGTCRAHFGMDDAQTIILFDGVCNLCSGTVRFIVRRDPLGHFRFAALQSAAAQRICRERGIAVPAATDPDSIIVIADGSALERSDAALAIAARLPFPWPILRVFRALPRPIRDALYRAVARNRYRLFGRMESCMVPTPELRARFID